VSSGAAFPANESKDFVLALDFGGTKIALATADRAANPIHQLRIETRSDDGAEQVITRALAAARSLVDETVTSGRRLVAVAAATFGVPLADRILLAPNVPGWGSLALERRLREGIGVAPVAVCNDVRAATTAELRRGVLRGSEVALYLSLGTGLSMGLVVGGRVIDGAHGAAGEIGYALRRAGEPGVAAGRAPLEEQVSGRAIGERASALFGRPLTTAEVFAAPRATPLGEFLTATLDELALHVTNLAIALDPSRIVVGGGLMKMADVILPRLRSQLAQAVPFPPEVLPARFIHDGPLHGAIALAWDSLATPALANVG
jgi:glucokinase